MASERANFEPVRLSSDDLPEHERLPVWREHFGRQMFLMDFSPAPDTVFRADMTMRNMPGMLVGSASFSPLSLLRPESYVADGNDDLWLLVPSAACKLSQRGKDVFIQPGDGAVVNGAEASTLVANSGIELRCAHIERNEVVPFVPHPEDAALRTIPRMNEVLQYFLSYRHFVQENSALSHPELARVAANHLRDLVVLVLGATRDATVIARSCGLREARLQAIKSHIEKNLGSPGLNIAKVANCHGITPRYIQRLFRAEGTTFSEFVVERRLERARDLLRDPAHLWRNISAIALEAGFGDISYFNRTFRQRFGMTPHEARELARLTN